MTRIGYARVQTSDLDARGQQDQLAAAGCETVVLEFGSARAPIEDRPQLARALADLVPGDALVVTELSRLTRHGQEAIELLERRGIELVVLDAPDVPLEILGGLS